MADLVNEAVVYGASGCTTQLGHEIREEDLPEIMLEYERLAEDLNKEGTQNAYIFFL